MVEIKISDRPVRFVRATQNPDFHEKRVIASSPWEFVALWLKKNHTGVAGVYWDQAKQFYESAKELPVQSAPLPLYYMIMNATKALLETKGVTYHPYHGVAGFDMRSPVNGRIRLDNEGIKIKGGGILPSLIAYLGETEVVRTYTLADIFSNLAFIHRAFSLSYNRAELFLSIRNPRYVKAGAGQARFIADLPTEHSHGQTLRTLPAVFNASRIASGSQYILESTATFPWSGARRPTVLDIQSLRAFHRALRLDLNYISGTQPYWYVKRKLNTYNRIERNNLTLLYMAMHRMSEISRYKPIELNRLLAGRRNWIIFEFVRVAQNQFIDEIAAEITGLEISPAGVRQNTFQ